MPGIFQESRKQAAPQRLGLFSEREKEGEKMKISSRSADHLLSSRDVSLLDAFMIAGISEINMKTLQIICEHFSALSAAFLLCLSFDAILIL